MPNRILKWISLLCLTGSFLLAQEEALFPIRIDGVIVTGNEKTREEVILREIPFQFPDTLEMADLELIQNRITNLFLFHRVELAILPDGARKFLLIQVTEMLYIYPVPLLFINERDWDKVSYGFQVTHVNFRGMHERASIGGWLGFNPSFFLDYYNPWVGKQSRFILGFNAFGKRVGNKFYDFDERHFGGSVTIGKRLGFFNRLEMALSLRRIGELPLGLSVSGRDYDLVPKATLQYLNDHRDLIEYPRSGYYIRWVATRTGISNDQPNFWSFMFDHRLYFKLSERWSIGGKNLLKLNSESLPIYDRHFIGYGDRIRGHFNRVMTGQNLMMHHLETRFTLLPVRYLSWNDAPPSLAAFFQQLKYGLSLGLFMDSGVVWGAQTYRGPGSDADIFTPEGSNKPLSLNSHYTGYGLGLHIHLPYINIFRIDHAWDDDGRGEWILEAGVVF